VAAFARICDVSAVGVENEPPASRQWLAPARSAQNIPTNYPEKARTEMTCEDGTEAIDLIEQFNFNLGRAIECIAHAGREAGEDMITDLERAQWHLDREIKRSMQGRESTVSSSRSSASPASPVCRLPKSQQNGAMWTDSMGDLYRFRGGAWEYQTAGQNTWEPVRFEEILTDFGPYTLVDQGAAGVNPPRRQHLPIAG
jgi:hypothetical protein